MSYEPNPLDREYSDKEWAAMKRVGLGRDESTPTEIWWNGGPGKQRGGPAIYGTGKVQVEDARQKANDWKTVADAMEREFYYPKESE